MSMERRTSDLHAFSSGVYFRTFTQHVILQINMYGLLTKFVWSRWLDIGEVFFCVFMDRVNGILVLDESFNI